MSSLIQVVISDLLKELHVAHLAMVLNLVYKIHIGEFLVLLPWDRLGRITTVICCHPLELCRDLGSCRLKVPVPVSVYQA